MRVFQYFTDTIKGSFDKLKVAPVPLGPKIINTDNKNSSLIKPKHKTAPSTPSSAPPPSISIDMLPIEILVQIFQSVLLLMAAESRDKADTIRQVLNIFALTNKKFYGLAHLLKSRFVTFNHLKTKIPRYKETLITPYHAFFETISLKLPILSEKNVNSRYIVDCLFDLAVRLSYEKRLPANNLIIVKFYYDATNFFAEIINHCISKQIKPTHGELGELMVYLSNDKIISLIKSKIISFDSILQFIKNIDFDLSKGKFVNLRTVMCVLDFLAIHHEKVKNYPDIMQKVNEHLTAIIKTETNITKIAKLMESFFNKLPIKEPNTLGITSQP